MSYAIDLSGYLLSESEKAILDARKRGILGDGVVLNDGSIEYPVIETGTVNIVGPVICGLSTVTVNYE